MHIQPSREVLIEMTELNPFDRFPDGRPRVPDELLERIKKATEALTSASHKLAEVMYQNAGANAAGGGAGATGGTDANASAGGDGNGKADDVIDAEVVDEHK